MVALVLVLLTALVFAKEEHYCIQLLSSKRPEELLKAYEKVKDYPYARVEKIGPYYTLRVGRWGEKEAARELLKELKRSFPDAFVRSCYYLPERVVLPKKVEAEELKVRGRTEAELICKAVGSLFKDFPKKEGSHEWKLSFESFYPYSVADALNYVLILHKKEGFVPVACRLRKEGKRYELLLKGYLTDERLPVEAVDYASVKETEDGVTLKLLKRGA
ncbi:MAG: SPOR domain-containing protein [Aquificae bacterium]|nr:SPOR domain-containing protein [Aquificota bacterium]